MRWFFRSMALVLLLGVVLAGCGTPKQKDNDADDPGAGEAEGLPVGTPAPEIRGKDLDGKPMKLSDFRGKVVLLDFWSST